MVSGFNFKGRAVFLLLVSILLITVYVTKFSRNSVNYVDKLQNFVGSLEFRTLKNEKLNTQSNSIRNIKKNAVQIMRTHFNEYWKSISSIIFKNATEDGIKDASALQDGFKVLDIRYEEIGNFFDNEVTTNFNYSSRISTEFYILSNLLFDLKYYWLHITSAIKRLGLSSDMQEFVNKGYIKLKKELKNLIEDSETIAHEKMDKLQLYVQKRINELQNPNDCNSASVYVCNMVNQAGFGSELHTILKCFLPAFKQQRTMIHHMKGWKYDPEGWSHLFAPLSDCDETQYTSQSNSQTVNGDAVYPTGYDFISIPEEIAEDIIQNHADPFAWWIAQFIGYAMRMRPEFVNQLNGTAQKIKFTNPIAGMHIRRGDKLIREAKKHEVEEYMFFIENWFDEQNIEQRTVYVTTDDDKVYQELTTKYPSYSFLTTPTDTMQRGLNALQGIVTDVYLLSLCDFVACTGSSNICRLVYELLTFNHHDASSRWQSVDDMYYFHEVMFPYVGISDHSSRKEKSEINVQKGDILRVAKIGVWPIDGFINCDNTNKQEQGRVPLYKIRSKPSVDSFSILNRTL